MRIYNASSSQVSIPLTSTEKIIVPAHGTSVSFMPNPKILSLIVTSFDYDDLALIVSGPIEMTMCSETACCAGFVVSSLEEALERFGTPVPSEGMKCAAKVTDPLNEERLEEEKKAAKEAEITEEPEPVEVLPVKPEQQVFIPEEEQVSAVTPKKRSSRKKKSQD